MENATTKKTGQKYKIRMREGEGERVKRNECDNILLEWTGIMKTNGFVLREESSILGIKVS